VQLHIELATAYAHELRLPHASARHLRAALALVEGPGSEGRAAIPSPQLARIEDALVERLREDRNHVELAARLRSRLERGRGEAADWLEIARLQAEQLHSPAAAADAYRERLALEPSCLAAIRGLRHVSECLGDWSEMACSLELELGLEDRGSPHEVVALQSRLGDVCWHRLNARERAADAYRAALAALPGDLDTLRSLQRLHENTGAYDEALDLYEREVAVLGDDDAGRRRELWLQVAHTAHRKTRDAERALTAYANAADLATLEPDDQRAWASLYHEVGDLDRYAEEFATWCDAARSGAKCRDHLSLTEALSNLGRREDALARCKIACEVDPGHLDAWDRLATLREEKGEVAEAREALVRAAALDEPRAAAERLIHASHLCPGDDAEAARFLRRAIECDPAFPIAHAELASVTEKLGELEDCEYAAGRALDLSTHDSDLEPAIRLATARIGGRVALRRERLEAAAHFYSKALELDPNDCESLDAQGEVLYACGEYSAARELLESRLEIGSTHAGRPRQTAMIARARARLPWPTTRRPCHCSPTCGSPTRVAFGSTRAPSRARPPSRPSNAGFTVNPTPRSGPSRGCAPPST